jgi:starch-binding outer membrane protein, SusD/RagB family
MNPIPRTNGGTRRWTRHLTASLVGAVAMIGCDNLLEVELPTRVPAATLDNPALALTLVQGAIADFECAFTNYTAATALLTDEMIDATGWIAVTQWDQRRIFPDNGNLGTSGCTALGYGLYTPIQTARFQAEDVFKRIEGFPDAEVANKNSLLATAAAYAGYSYVLLGEGFCAVTVDGGPLMTQQETLARAEERFTTAIQLAQSANNNNILNMARVGRARARLVLGKTAEAAADARAVPENFVLNATYSTANTRRWNRVAADFHRNFFLSVDPRFRGLTVDGQPDPRVPVLDGNRNGHDGSTRVFNQTKYRTEADPIPLATWREAQLIIAEAEGGQGAVDAINRVRAFWGLPAFAGGSAQEIQAQVREERRRELFLQGHRLGDMLRFNLPFDTGATHKGVTFGETTCLPLPDAERLNNPNIG